MPDILLLHEMHEDAQIPQEPVLTFDDGLYTQYNVGRKLPNKRKIFFISTKFICTGNQSTEFIHCRDAHQKAFAGNYENYMTLDQILELLESGCEIGGHSHAHVDLNDFASLKDKTNHIISDTETMLEWFSTHMNIQPTSFAFPYNDDCKGFYKMILRQKFGFTEFFGDERITLDETPV